MSTYYYFSKEGTNEYFELGSRSWYPYYEELLEVLQYSITHNTGFDKFLVKLQKLKTFDGYYDDGDFIDTDNIKYFLKPLYQWASDAPRNGVHNLGVFLVSEYEVATQLYRMAYEEFGIDANECNSLDKSDSELIADEKVAEKYDGKSVWETYFRKVGSIWWEETPYQELGVNFERALAEMKAGNKVWRLKNPELKYWIVNNEIESTQDRDNERWGLKSEDILAEDWSF